MPFLPTDDDIELYYTDEGFGSPVVLIHGWPLNSCMWDLQENFLLEHGFRVVKYDRRGYGQSDKPFSGYDYDTFASDLNTIMEELDLQDATLVGFSMGGGEVVRYLARYGAARVSRAVLVGSVTPFLSKTSDNPEGVDPKVFTTIEDQIRKDRFAFLQDFGPKFYGRTTLSHTVSQGVLDWTFAMAITGTLRSTLAAAQAWSMTDFRADMTNIAIPVRIIHGTGDLTVPIDTAGRRSLAILPNATLTEYEGEPHGLFITAADTLNQELLEFIGATAVPNTRV